MNESNKTTQANFVDSISGSTTTAKGFFCSICGVWIPEGCTHSCSQPTITTTFFQKNSLERIADALERIANAIESM